MKMLGLFLLLSMSVACPVSFADQIFTPGSSLFDLPDKISNLAYDRQTNLIQIQVQALISAPTNGAPPSTWLVSGLFDDYGPFGPGPSDQFEVGPGSPIQYGVWQTYTSDIDYELYRVIFSIDGTVVGTSHGDSGFSFIQYGSLSNSGGNDSMTIRDVSINYSPEPNTLGLCIFSSAAFAGILLIRRKCPGSPS